MPDKTNVDAVKDVDDLFAVDHPLDLSFTKDKNYGKRGGLTGYASDNDKRTVTKQSIDDFKSSIISSDDSIVAKIEQNQQNFDGPLTKRDMMKKRSATKLVSTKELPGGLKRMLTTDFKDKSRMNDSQSTYMGYNPSFAKQLDCLSGLQAKPYDKESARKIKNRLSLTLDVPFGNDTSRNMKRDQQGTIMSGNA